MAARSPVTFRLLAIVVLLLGPPAAEAGQHDGRPVVALTVSGLRNLDESVVVQQIATRAGRPYSQQVADQDIVRLERLRVFSGIAIIPESVDDGVRVDVRVVETQRVFPAPAIAVSDESGTSVGVALKVLSIRHRPHDLTMLARFGGEQVVEFTETSPLLTGRRLWHSARVTLRDRLNRIDDFGETSLDADGRIGVRASDTWRAGAILQAFAIHSNTEGVTLSADDSDAFVSLGAVLEHDSRDSWRTPTRGWWNSADVLWRMGNADYVTFNADVRRYQPLGDHLTMLGTALLTLQSGESGVDIPTYMDYTLGGANTVRGWDFASRRGKNQFISSLELRRTVVPTRPFRVFGLNFYGGVAIAAFGDVGSAWGSSDAVPSGTIGGGGLGLRIFVPYVDVIRIDFGYGNSLQALVGVAEKAVAQRLRVR